MASLFHLYRGATGSRRKGIERQSRCIYLFFVVYFLTVYVSFVNFLGSGNMGAVGWRRPQLLCFFLSFVSTENNISIIAFCVFIINRISKVSNIFYSNTCTILMSSPRRIRSTKTRGDSFPEELLRLHRSLLRTVVYRVGFMPRQELCKRANRNRPRS